MWLTNTSELSVSLSLLSVSVPQMLQLSEWVLTDKALCDVIKGTEPVMVVVTFGPFSNRLWGKLQFQQEAARGPKGRSHKHRDPLKLHWEKIDKYARLKTVQYLCPACCCSLLTR